MDPVQKLWMYENWIADQNDNAELAKNHAYLLASFWDPEAVKSIVGDGNSHQSNEEEFEESSRMVKDMDMSILAGLNLEDPQLHRKRKHTLKE